jgi:hypothetical protein
VNVEPPEELACPDDPKYILRFFYEWGGGCLWAGNEAARHAFGYGPYDVGDDCPLPLSPEVLERCRRLTEWHDSALNWDYPPDPGPWRQAECDRFNSAAKDLLSAIRIELGTQFRVLDKQNATVEDPNLNAYLADPKGFRQGPSQRIGGDATHA